ncbi:hypothetical protein CWB79_07385 [Pseudoalteromonas sp. S1649]|nr:hypothetical protein CWB79_07385 [Pseudoalteromonas sp. S1649]
MQKRILVLHRLVTFFPFLLVFTLLGTFVAVTLTFVIGSFYEPKGLSVVYIFLIYPLSLLIGSPFSLSVCIVFCILIGKFKSTFNQYYQNKFYSKAKSLGLYLGATSGFVIHIFISIITAIQHRFKQSKYLDEPFLTIDLLNKFCRNFIELSFLMIIVPSAVCGFVAIKLFGPKVLNRLS